MRARKLAEYMALALLGALLAFALVMQLPAGLNV